MSTTPHPRAQLSAYIDDALAPGEGAAVRAHLDVCADCRARVAELRAAARLIAALPDPRPTRRLVPRVAAPPVWLAPLRTLTTLASGVSVFLFLATALLANVGSLAPQSATTGLGGAAAAPAASAPPVASAAAFGAAAPESQRNAAGSTASGVPPVGAPLPSVPPLSTASSGAARDAVKSAASASPSPNTQFAVTGTTTPQDAASRNEHAAEPARAGSALATPWLWLALAVVTGAIAILLQRRLAASR